MELIQIFISGEPVLFGFFLNLLLRTEGLHCRLQTQKHEGLTKPLL